MNWGNNERRGRPRSLRRTRSSRERRGAQPICLGHFGYTNTDWLHEQNRNVDGRTPCLGLAQVGADLPCAYADHTETLCLVKCPDLFLRLAERHAISKFTEFGLRVSFLGLARTGVLELSVNSRAEQEELHAPPATTSLLRAVVGYGESFDYLRWWRRGQPVEVLLDLFSELLSISTCNTGEKTSFTGE